MSAHFFGRLGSSGQSVIESAIALPIALVGASGFLVLIWSLSVSVLTHHTLYEMLVCYETYPNQGNCLQTAQATIQHFMLFGHLDKIEYARQESHSLAVANVSLPLNLKMHLKESVHLPIGRQSQIPEAQ